MQSITKKLRHISSIWAKREFDIKTNYNMSLCCFSLSLFFLQLLKCLPCEQRGSVEGTVRLLVSRSVGHPRPSTLKHLNSYEMNSRKIGKAVHGAQRMKPTDFTG